MEAARFEETERVVASITDALNRGDLDAVEELVDEDLEYVTRDGPGRGRRIFRDVWEPQLSRFDIDFVVERVVDVGDGRFILLQQVDRKDPKTGEVELRMWPAIVGRVRGGKLVFMEGYPDRRKAFTDLGLEPE